MYLKWLNGPNIYILGAILDKKGAKNLVIWYQIKRNWQPRDNVLGSLLVDPACSLEDGRAG